MPETNYKTVKERITEKQQIRDNLILLKRQRKKKGRERDGETKWHEQ